jgi:hypothetical protein
MEDYLHKIKPLINSLYDVNHKEKTYIIQNGYDEKIVEIKQKLNNLK